MTTERRCEMCPKLLTGRQKATCSLRCRDRAMSGASIGYVPTAAVSAHVERQRQRAKAKLIAEFGPLTDREVALVKLAGKRYYAKGYYVGARESRRRAACAA